MSTPRTRVGPFATLMLALLRIGIGWHFLYEGVLKLVDPQWTAAAYLKGSTGPLAWWFRQLAADPAHLRLVDQLNIAGLAIIGACLILGLLTRVAAFAGIGMLAMYYLAYPSLTGDAPAGTAEGHYLVINKNLVELLALCVTLVLPATALGIDGMFFGRRRKAAPVAAAAAAGAGAAPAKDAAAPAGPDAQRESRRSLLVGLAGVPFLGAFAVAFVKRHGWVSYEEKHLRLARADAKSSPSVLKFDLASDASKVQGKLPTAKIGNLPLSRMILGGNLIGGWAHARDLIYVSNLVKAYHSREKIFQTFQLAEACGITAFLTNPALCDIMTDYWRSTGGKLQFISDCGGDNILDATRKSIDNGACACYVQGGIADSLVEKGDFDTIAKMLDLVRQNKLPAGIGGHKLKTIQACVEKGLKPDFWMKTLHQTHYWSARTKPENDNIWCDDPAATIEYMKSLPEPWIAFKILAAGALQPRDAFRFAFTGGADFICVGMYDFQIVEDVNIALDILKTPAQRERRWLA